MKLGPENRKEGMRGVVAAARALASRARLREGHPMTKEGAKIPETDEEREQSIAQHAMWWQGLVWHEVDAVERAVAALERLEQEGR
jgi:hypothetical protein